MGPSINGNDNDNKEEEEEEERGRWHTKIIKANNINYQGLRSLNTEMCALYIHKVSHKVNA